MEEAENAALLFLHSLKMDGKMPIPDACWPCFKWLTINIQINKIIKMEKLVRDKFSGGQPLDTYYLGTTSTT